MLKTRLKIITAIFFLTIFSGSVNLYGGRGDWDESFSGPQLLYPITHDIDLGGKEFLEFRWRDTDIARTDYYDLRVYEGFDRVKENLILRKQVSRDEFPINIPATTFKVDQVYTWVLVQVFLDGKKTDKSYSTFTVVSK